MTLSENRFTLFRVMRYRAYLPRRNQIRKVGARYSVALPGNAARSLIQGAAERHQI
jgi:hypothetical protein